MRLLKREKESGVYTSGMELIVAIESGYTEGGERRKFLKPRVY
jgi:hypothetical protein